MKTRGTPIWLGLGQILRSKRNLLLQLDFFSFLFSFLSFKNYCSLICLFCVLVSIKVTWHQLVSISLATVSWSDFSSSLMFTHASSVSTWNCNHELGVIAFPKGMCVDGYLFYIYLSFMAICSFGNPYLVMSRDLWGPDWCWLWPLIGLMAPTLEIYGVHFWSTLITLLFLVQDIIIVLATRIVVCQNNGNIRMLKIEELVNHGYRLKVLLVAC